MLFCTRCTDNRDAVIRPFRHVAISIHRNEFLLRGENPIHPRLEDELLELEVDLHWKQANKIMTTAREKYGADATMKSSRTDTQ
jgi:hypothetical protein